MKKFTFLFVSFIILFSSVAVLTFEISERLADYHDKKQQIAIELDFMARLGDVWEWIPFSGAGEEKVERWGQLLTEADAFYDEAINLGFLLGIIVLVFTVTNIIYYRSRDHKQQIYGLVMVFSALSFLYLGLQSPFMEIEAFKRDLTIEVPVGEMIAASPVPVEDLANGISDYLGLENLGVPENIDLPDEDYVMEKKFDGRMYAFYQNKSILQLLSLLYTGGNFFVALCLFFFSIVFPIVKLITSMIVFLNPHTSFAKKAVPVINNLGKWSMADVFVAAIFLAFFAFTNMNVGIDTGSTTLIGTYFFVAFVVLSIASGFVFKRLTGKS